MAKQPLHRSRLHRRDKMLWVAGAGVAFTVRWAAGGLMELLNDWVQHWRLDVRLAEIDGVYCVALRSASGPLPVSHSAVAQRSAGTAVGL